MTKPIISLKQALDSCKEGELWSNPIYLKRNEFLLKKGQLSPWLYYVESGAIRVYYETEEQDLTIRFGYKGSFISALPSFLLDKPSDYYIQALKASKLRAIHRDALQEEIKKNPVLAELFHRATEQTLLEQMEREIDILTPSPAERYARVLKRSPRLFQEISNKYIASYLRMTPETLSRLKKS